MKKLITFSPRTLEMIDALKKQTGFNKTTQIVIRGIEELYTNTFKYGKDPLIGGSTVGDNSDEAITKQAERKAKLEVAKKKASDDLKLAPKIKICEIDLGGEVVTQENGSQICKWQTHDRNASYDQTIPLFQVGAYLLDNLFQPDKETVLKARPELRKKFKS